MSAPVDQPNEETCPWRPHSQPEGMEPCDCEERLAEVTVHSRTKYGNDPWHCQECSAAVQEWVTWDACVARRRPAPSPAGDLSDQEALAQVIGCANHEPSYGTCVECESAAERVLDWMGERDAARDADLTRRAARDAWDEGYEAGVDDENYNQRGVGYEPGHPHANPYADEHYPEGDA